MGGQLATIAVTRRSAGRFAFDCSFSLFLRGIENALGDLDILQRQVTLIGAELFGFGAELVAPEFADDHLKPAPRLFHLGKGGLRLRQKRLQPGILRGKSNDIHALLQSQAGRRRHRENRH